MPINTENPIQIIRGDKASISARTGKDGEPNWATDTHELYIHDGVTPGGHKVGGGQGTDIDLSEIESSITDLRNEIVKTQLSVNGKAPMPVRPTTSIGCWREFSTSAGSGDSYRLPSGGTYAYIIMGVATATATVEGIDAGVVAGGSTISVTSPSGVVIRNTFGLQWKIA